MSSPADWSSPPLRPSPPPLPPVPEAPSTRPNNKRYYSTDDIWFLIVPCGLLFIIGLIGTAVMKNDLVSLLAFPPTYLLVLNRRRVWLLFMDIRRYPESLNLTEHLQALLPGHKIEVHIDWSDKAHNEAYAIRKGNVMLISRYLQTRLTPPKLDYVLVRTALNDKTLVMRMSLIAAACISALCWLPFYIGITLFIILGGVAAGLAIKHEKDSSATQKALELTGDLEAALESLPALCDIECGRFDFRTAQVYETQMLAKGQVLGLPVPPWDSPYKLY